MARALLIPLVLAACAAPAPLPEAPPDGSARDPAFTAYQPATMRPFAPDLVPSGSAQGGTARAVPVATSAFKQGLIPGLHLKDETDLQRVMGFLSAASGVSIVVEDRAQEALDDADIAFHVNLERRMSLNSALSLLQELADGAFAWKWYGETALVITTPERARGGPERYVFEVSDLVRGVQSYVPRVPSFNVSPSGGLFPADEDELEPARVVDEDVLVDLIENTIGPEYSARIVNGKLIVTRR